MNTPPEGYVLEEDVIGAVGAAYGDGLRDGAAAERDRIHQAALAYWRKRHGNPGYVPTWFADLLREGS